MRYFLELRYRGTHFFGWQRQPEVKTVQGEIESALSTILKQQTLITGCGRTDTGVHSYQYFAHFNAAEKLDDYRLLKSINGILNQDIEIIRLIPVSEENHARFDASARTYHYYLHLGKNPFLKGLSTSIRQPLDLEVMNASAIHFLGEKDFSSFEKIGADNATSICNVTESHWIFKNDQWRYRITANRFVRNMVRAIVGTQLDIARRRFSIDDLPEIIAAKDRGMAGTSAPAEGLYLEEIQYPFL